MTIDSITTVMKASRRLQLPVRLPRDKAGQSVDSLGVAATVSYPRWLRGLPLRTRPCIAKSLGRNRLELAEAAATAS